MLQGLGVGEREQRTMTESTVHEDRGRCSVLVLEELFPYHTVGKSALLQLKLNLRTPWNRYGGYLQPHCWFS